jgi:hypothetical protein
MKNQIHIALGVDQVTRSRLDSLRQEFARACNWIAPIAQVNHCWNRVALHHLVYHGLRKAFPELGAQMACNAIYSVCRCYRLILSHPQSPLFEQKIQQGDLPLIHFLDNSPVYFDRHTLSLNKNMVSLFTLEGRLRFQAELNAEDEEQFRSGKLQEIQLITDGPNYFLTMQFSVQDSKESILAQYSWPNYFVLLDQPNKQGLFNEASANTSSDLKRVS